MTTNYSHTDDGIRQEFYNEDEISLIDYWYILVRRKWLIFVIVGVVFVASIIISLLFPKIYASTASILPQQQQNSMYGMSAVISQFGNLGNFTGMSSPSDLWVGILQSDVVLNAIIARFKLMEVYDVEHKVNAMERLRSNVNITDSKEGIIYITFEDKDPDMAAQLANAFVEELDKINRHIIITSGKRSRIFIEKRLNEAKKKLSLAEDAIKSFQENQSVQLNSQSDAVISAINGINSQILAKKVALQTMLSYSTAEHPKVQLLKTELEELKKRFNELTVGTEMEENSDEKNTFIPTNMIPDLSLQYTRLLRELNINENLFQLLNQQYEMARIQEAKDSPTVEVLYRAEVPEIRSKPKRKLIVMLSTVSATFLAIFIAFFIEYINKIKVSHDSVILKD